MALVGEVEAKAMLAAFLPEPSPPPPPGRGRPTGLAGEAAAKEIVRWATKTGQSLTDYQLATLLALRRRERPKGIHAKYAGAWKAELAAMRRAVARARQEAKKLVPVPWLGMVPQEAVWRVSSILGGPSPTPAPFPPEHLALVKQGNRKSAVAPGK
ncbi:MAG: hypothetical protein IRY87_00010 [Acetobacteraceae bacterium]|nr:hypothetical protein [Acetobacteraceae bacterium]